MLIVSAETFAKIRLLRNEIAHEYMPEAIYKIFGKVLEWTPVLLDAVRMIKKYTAITYSPYAKVAEE